MTEDITTKVKAKYALIYPKWTGVEVEETILTTANVAIVVVRANDENGNPMEPEVCFVPHDAEAIVFGHTRDLAYAINTHFANRGWFDRLFSRTGITGIVMIVLLVTLCGLAFYDGEENEQIIQLLGAAFIGAVGFYFGTVTQPK